MFILNNKKTRVCYILSYKDPDYIRSKTLLEALAGINEIELYVASNKSRGFSRYYQTIKELLSVKSNYDPDIFILGFRGHEIYWPVRWIIGKNKLFFDALVSPYASLVEERKYGLFGATLARILLSIEYSILKNADLIITDTSLHTEFYHNYFKIPFSQIFELPISAIEEKTEYKTDQFLPKKIFSVLFYGSFLPLHGIEVIIRAAEILNAFPIRFDFIGGSKKQEKKLHFLCRKYNINNYTYRNWVPRNELVTSIIPNTSLCLGGPFGNTPQALRVITGKAVQCLALGKPTILGEIPLNYGQINKYNSLVVEQGNPYALANIIIWSFLNQEQIKLIGEKGRELYEKRFSVHHVQEIIKKKVVP